MNTQVWIDMFAMQLPVIEKILRPLFVYLFLIIGLRLAGKRELAQLNPFDLVVLLTLSNTVQNAIIGNDNSVTGGLIGASALLAINFLVVRYVAKHPFLNRLAEGKKTVLIDNGKIQYEQLESEAITEEELQIAAHKQGFESLKEVNQAVLEPGGVMTFTRKEIVQSEKRYEMILEQLQHVTSELNALRISLPKAGN
jgi:uncharacterized membrane protein YcaP (DUF421 family)